MKQYYAFKDWLGALYSPAAKRIPRLACAWLLAVAWLAGLNLWLGAQAQVEAMPVVGQEHVGLPGPAIVSSTLQFTYHVYLPLVARPVQTPTVPEIRAVWVSRYDWTRLGISPTVSDVQHVVDVAAQAGFNAIFFQARGAGDAYYTPGLEPWAARLTGSLGPTLGQDPGWDPLSEVISRAHAAGLQVHAWVNVYPTWQAPPSSTYGALVPSLDVLPPQALNRFTYLLDGSGYGLGYTWRVYDRPTSDGYMPIQWNQYTWASPAVPQVQDHVANVVADIVARYNVDGIHLDNVRYPGQQYSLDPFTLAAFASDPLSQTLTITDWRPNFQRAQVTQFVARITTQTHAARPTLTVSAAVWPSFTQGCQNYYQDSQGWTMSGTIDALAPMLYSSKVITDLQKWTEAAAGFQARAGGRWVLPGIGVSYAGECVPFEHIAARIQAARDLGTAGYAVFSLSALEACGYVDDVRNEADGFLKLGYNVLADVDLAFSLGQDLLQRERDVSLYWR